MRLKVFLLILFISSILFAKNNEDFRAVWVVTWHHSSSSDDVAASKARIEQILDNVKSANMNAVLWQVRQGGTAYYNSSYEPWGPYCNGPYPGDYDILEYAVEQAHLRGLEIHAWFNSFAASSSLEGTPASDNPEWICRDGYNQPMPKSYALSPGLEMVRDYTLQVAMEVVNNYDIDGLHLDYIRWNEYYRSSWDGALQKTSKTALLDGFISEQEIESLTNTANPERYLYDIDHPYSGGVPDSISGTPFSSWENYWRWSVTEFVKTLHSSIQAVKPWVRLSPAALGRYRWDSWQGYGSVFQDAALWFNEGFIDQLTPMHYHWFNGDDFYGMLTANGSSSWGHWIQPGLAAGRLFTVGPYSWKLGDSNLWYRHPSIVDRCRDVSWVDGFQFYEYGSWQAYRYWESAKELFFQEKTKIRAAKFLSADIPDSPSLDLQKIDSMYYEISVEPPVGLSFDQWFAVYRSEDATLDVTNDEIIDIHFGKASYTVVDTFSGTQDFAGHYTYFSSMLDRFWNESAISNSLISDNIPSFAPQVINTFPLVGDSLSVNQDIKIYFSKTMNVSSFVGRVQVDNAAQIAEIEWTNNDKDLTISFISNLAFNTLYTLTISDSVTDVNEKMLDGYGDGGSSEPFIFSFQTFGEDKSGPEIDYSNLLLSQTVDEFDIKDVITLGFNELLDESSVTEDNVQIFRNDKIVPSKFKLNTTNGNTVLSVQPEEPFGSYIEYTINFGTSIADTAGNPLTEALEYFIQTEALAYDEENLIDEFAAGTANWWDPEGSGSTKGTIGGNTTFGSTSSHYLPSVSRPYQKYSARLNYEWDPNYDFSEGPYLLREYCAGGDPRAVTFDTSYTMQCYIYGDGSGNQFRFSLSEKNGQGYALEVSKWIDINWLGWKLVEWQLNDSSMIGTWLGDEILNGTHYTIDSFQLTHPDGGAVKGSIYFSNLRVVKKSEHYTGIENIFLTPAEFSLSQNYPNPFNPVTRINFSLERTGQTRLIVYNMLGQKVKTLIDKNLNPGSYRIQFNAGHLASGTYVYELRTNGKTLRKRMVILK